MVGHSSAHRCRIEYDSLPEQLLTMNSGDGVGERVCTLRVRPAPREFTTAHATRPHQ
jgi:hypothetical protein